MPAWRAITRVPRLPRPAAGKMSHQRKGSELSAMMNSTIAPSSHRYPSKRLALAMRASRSARLRSLRSRRRWPALAPPVGISGAQALGPLADHLLLLHAAAGDGLLRAAQARLELLCQSGMDGWLKATFAPAAVRDS